VPNRVIKSRMRWTGQVACMGIGDERTGLWWGELMEGDHSEYLGIDVRTALKLISRNGMGHRLN
jgi:hypothetical protein